MHKYDADAADVRRNGHVIFTLEQLERLAEGDDSSRITLTGVKFKLDADGGTSVLLVLQGFREEREYVAFVGGYDMISCLLTLRRKLQKNRIGWRESRPWGS